MSSEIPIIAGDSGGSIYRSAREHFVTLFLVGEPQEVRVHLVQAVERLGYRVLSDEPFVVRHPARSSTSMNFLDYGRTISFRLKASGPGLTQVDFNYAVGYPMTSRRAQAVITREAKAIAALASERQAGQSCPACGAEATDDSRFCRRCGKPMSKLPAELEVLHLSAEMYAGIQGIVFGAIGVVLSIITLAFVLAMKGPTAFVAAVVLALLWLIATFPVMLFGIRRLSRAVKGESVTGAAFLENQPQLSTTNKRGSLAAASSGHSVTEATTELLAPHQANVAIVAGRQESDML